MAEECSAELLAIIILSLAKQDILEKATLLSSIADFFFLLFLTVI